MESKTRTNTKRIVIISSLVSISLVLFVAFNANRYIERISYNNSELYSAFRISELMKLFRSNILVLEAKQRGYLVTGDGKFLEEYKLKETETKTCLKSMEKYFSGKPEEEAFYKLKELTYRKLQEGKDLSHSLEGIPGAADRPGTTIRTMEEINTTVDQINESLNTTTKTLLDNSVDYVDTSQYWSYLEIAVAVFTSLIAVWFLFRDTNVRNRLQEELTAAKARADQNALTKEQFMANMSHEIRTPMNAIVGFSDLLRKTQLSPLQKEYLSAIKSSSSNLLNIINDILDFSKIEAGKLSLEKISFSVPAVIDSLKLIFKEKAKEKGIAFEATVDRNIPALVFGDPTRLTQILVNLLGNAVKFTHQGQVTLSCEIKSIEHDMVQLVFRIKDSGIGIPSDKQEQIFERFNQGNADTTRKFGGTGLGLAIVKNLVEIHNGSLNLKSKEGLGSEFSVSLSYPVSYENVSARVTEAPANFKIEAGKPLKALLAEDNVLNQKLACTYLTGFGMEVEIAGNGSEAIEKTRSNNFDLILMDIQMPVMDGYNAVRTIRNTLKITAPVIAMTAHTMEGEKEKCLSYGMNDYISKPFSEAQLFEIVSRHVGNNSIQPGKNPIINTATETKTTTVDMDQLFSLSRGNNGFIREIIGVFMDENPRDLQRLEEAIEKNDFETIRAVSHKMKTSLGFMGIKLPLPAVSLIEKQSAQKTGIAEIREEFNKVQASCAAAMNELNAVLVSLSEN